MKRFRDDFNTIAQCGILDNGGVTRLALTPPDHEARTCLIKIMDAAGLDIHIDAAGNIHGILPGTQAHLPAVVVGSHLDTVPHGGHYDGVIGVLAGIEIARRIQKDALKPKRSLRIINFCAEESSRFGVATLGSKAITHKIDPDKLKDIRDRDGISFYTALKQSGSNIDALEHDILGPEDIYAFLNCISNRVAVLKKVEQI